MTEMATVRKAIEDSQTEMKGLFEQQRKEIEEKGKINEQLTKELQRISEESKRLGERLFDIEQKGVKGSPKARKSAISSFGEEAVAFNKSNGRGVPFTKDIKSFHKALTVEGDDATASALELPYRVPGIIVDPSRPTSIRDLLSPGRLTQSALEYVREELFDNKAKVVAEGAQKPESKFQLSKQSANAKVIAHWTHASKQALYDAPQLQGYVDSRLLIGLREAENYQLLNGDGTGDDLEGLNKVATAYDTSLTEAGDNAADVLAHAMLQVSESFYSATGFILNPRDWHRIALMKDGNGNYLFGGPEAFARGVIWGLPVVTTATQAQGTFTAGAFGLASQIWDLWDATITTSDSDRDNFIKNMITILAEERLLAAHYRPAAIVKGTFATQSK
ncbi:hypothetical protein R84981_000976 [Carnimonas sp. R-84981]|uniref:phage major capsid protein n=1 Tax=Carnimonas bestiolae TaxID=3402172 RepID=UPI003EDC5270